jgi:hypothetical protein
VANGEGLVPLRQYTFSARLDLQGPLTVPFAAGPDLSPGLPVCLGASSTLYAFFFFFFLFFFFFPFFSFFFLFPLGLQAAFPLTRADRRGIVAGDCLGCAQAFGLRRLLAKNSNEIEWGIRAKR